MIQAKLCQPRLFPHNSARAPEQIDRAQDISGNLTINQTKLYEIGRDGKLGVRKESPSLSYSMTQFEYGSMSFWYALANMEDPASGGLDDSIDLDDIKSTTFDITAYMTDDDATFRGTMWFPKLRVNGFSLNIGDPDATVERSFDFVGEDFKILDGKYFAYETDTVLAPGDGTVTLDPVAVEYASGDYIFRVLRIRAGVSTELLEDVGAGANTWSYSAPTVTVKTCETSDILKVYYESSTAYDTLWADNDVDSDALFAEACEIYMKVGTGTRIYRLQSVGIDVAFERQDWKEIGNKEVVQRGVKSKTVTVALNRFNEGFSLEDILATDTTYPYIDPREFSESIQLMVKIFTDSTHETFAMGYLITGLSPTALGTSQAIEDYNQLTNSLESDNLKISSDESEIVFA
ncbi:MAG TPA: hypothetical protein VMV43_01670 [Candidatus Nanopelagicaceae bacterium]|nr:hypothetical protein [Candidatus Nanopelagicaceae bacterium]